MRRPLLTNLDRSFRRPVSSHVNSCYRSGPGVSDDASAAGDALINSADDKFARQDAAPRGTIVLHAGLPVFPENSAAAFRKQFIARLRRGVSNERYVEWCWQRMEQKQRKAKCKEQYSRHRSSPLKPSGSARPYHVGSCRVSPSTPCLSCSGRQRGTWLLPFLAPPAT